MSNNVGNCVLTDNSSCTNKSNVCTRKFTPSIDMDTVNHPTSGNFGGLQTNVPGSTNIALHDLGGFLPALESINPDLLIRGFLNVNLTIMIGESQNPSPYNVSLLNERFGPWAGVN